MRAVITGDLVSSTTIPNSLKESTIEALEKEVRTWKRELLFEEEEIFYRGDSLQIALSEPNKAFKVALCMRLSAKLASEKMSDLRFAIGLGPIEYLSNRITKSDGEAFRYSGRALEKMTEERMCVKTKNDQWDESINTSFLLADTLIDSWSLEVIEATYFSLKGQTQRELAERLEISQPAIHKRLKTGGYHSISQLENHFNKAVEWI